MALPPKPAKTSQIKVEEVSELADLWSPRPIDITFSSGHFQLVTRVTASKASKKGKEPAQEKHAQKSETDGSSPAPADSAKEKPSFQTKSKNAGKQKPARGGWNPTFIVATIAVIIGLFYLRYYVGDPITDTEAFEKNYEILGLSTSAADADVKKRYKELALQMHPDKCPECGDKFQEVKKAKEAILTHGAYFRAKRSINTDRIPVFYRTGPSKPVKERENPWSANEGKGPTKAPPRRK